MKKQTKLQDIGTYEAESEGVTAKLTLKTKIIDTETILGRTKTIAYGSDYYFFNLSFSKLNYDFSRTTKYTGKVNLYLGSSYISDIFNLIKENAEQITTLLDPRTRYLDPRTRYRSTKWSIIKCAFSLEEQTKHLYEERSKAKEERKRKFEK